MHQYFKLENIAISNVEDDCDPKYWYCILEIDQIILNMKEYMNICTAIAEYEKHSKN